MSALVLRLLDVPGADIIADYLRIAANMHRITARFRGWHRYRDHMASVPSEVYEAREYTIRGFLDAVDGQYGGAYNWAVSRGIEPQVIQRLRDGLLVPA